MTDNKNCSEPISSVMHSYLKELEYRMQHDGKSLGLSTGIHALDEKLGGIRGGEVILLGARPAMGKTSFAINLSYKIAKSFLEEQNTNANKSVLWFSIESSQMCVITRLLAAQIPDVWPHQLARYEYGSKSYKEFEKIADIGEEIKQLPIYINDKLCLIEEIEEEIYQFNQSHNIGFIVIDYLQLIKTQENQYREIKDYDLIVQKLKSIAQDLNVPIFILSQLTRALESRTNKCPTCNDLRQLKKLASVDKLLFLYREYYYLINDEPQIKLKETEEHLQIRIEDWRRRCKEQENLAEIIIAKNNSGGTGFVKCFCNLDKCEFSDLCKSEENLPDCIPF